MKKRERERVDEQDGCVEISVKKRLVECCGGIHCLKPVNTTRRVCFECDSKGTKQEVCTFYYQFTSFHLHEYG